METSETSTSRTEPTQEDKPPIISDEDFLSAYGDFESFDAWLKEHVTSANVPPVSFTADGVPSDQLTWTKEVGEAETCVDYPDDNPVERIKYTMTFTSTIGLQVTVDITSYPNYPIVEYEAYLKNISESNSPEIRDVMSISAPVIPGCQNINLHWSTGASYESMDEFHPHTDVLNQSDQPSMQFEVTNGKPTSTYMPNFNIENPEKGNGVITVMSWQGNWKSSFEIDEDKGVTMTAGQYETDFVLTAGEAYRMPMIVLLFYQGEYIQGQNIWRRWLYQHNVMRDQGVRMERNILVCVGSAVPNAVDDMKALTILQNSALLEYIDFFNQDAAWYEFYHTREDWSSVGNWYADPVRYPEGLRPVTDKVRQAGLEYALWLEPERVIAGTKTFTDLEDMILAINLRNFIETGKAPDNSRAVLIPYDEIPEGKECLVNYSIPKAVDYIIDTLDSLFTREGIEQYRQDFNIYPAPFWAAYDRYITEEMGIPRTGLTEEKYCTGYLRLWRTLIERHPGMMIDACASGSMRNDLATMRMSFVHTRTDWYRDTIMSQNHTYGYSLWNVLGGTGFSDLRDEYDIRSRLSTGIGIGIDPNGGTNESLLLSALTEWMNQASYMLYDYYPLSEYNKMITSMQFNDPATGRGMIACYLRRKTEGEIYPKELVPDAVYDYWSVDAPDEIHTISGREWMENGLNLQADARCALIFEYQRQPYALE